MRRLVVALVIASIAVLLAACGGGGGTPAATAAAPAAPAPATAPAPAPVANTGSAAAAAVVTTGSATNLLSPQEPGVNGPFPREGKQVPDVIADHLAKREPMLVFFYDPKQSATEDQRTQIDGALKQYRGLIDLVELDVTGALPDPVTNEPSKDKLGEQVALLVQDLKIGYTPYVILVDKQGIMTARHRGFVDQALLERDIVTATQ